MRAEHLGGREVVEIPFRSPAGDRDDIGIGKVASQFHDDINARFPRHHEVNDEQVDKILAIQRNARGAIGGIQHFMEHLMPRMAAGWPGLGNPEFTPELAQQIVKGVLEEADGRSIDELAAERDEMLFGLLSVRAEYGSTPA